MFFDCPDNHRSRTSDDEDERCWKFNKASRKPGSGYVHAQLLVIKVNATQASISKV